MLRPFIALAVALAASSAFADEAANCSAGAGSYLSGTVVGAPKFTHGRFRKGIELSHTHLRLREDRSGRIYDVAIDNVFASGYQRNEPVVPAPINEIRLNDRLAVCGALYDRGDGIHWVHPTCRGRPSPQHPDGWLKRIGSDGKASDNFEANTSYCRIF